MRRFSIVARLGLIAAVFGVPILLLVFFLVGEQAKNIEFSEAEIRGTEYHAPARALLDDLVRHRTLGARIVAGDDSLKGDLAGSQAKVDTDFAALAAADAKLGAEMRTTPLLNALKLAWEDLKPRVQGYKPAELGSYMAAHDRVVYDLIRLVNKMGNHSNLILDPDIDTYYLMDATQFKLPALVDHLGRAQALGAAIIQLSPKLADPKTTPDADLALIAAVADARALLEAYDVRNEATLEEGRANLDYAFEANAGMRAAMAGSSDLLASAVEESLATTRARIVQVPRPQIEMDAWLSTTDRALSSTLSLFDASLVNLEQGLAARVDRLEGSRRETLIATAIVLLVAMTLVRVIASSITRPLRDLTNAAERISTGDLRHPVDTTGADEIADLARRFRRMQESIRIAAEQVGDL